MIAMTRPLNELVKPELRAEWDTDIYPNFFVQDPANIDQCRQPGLFKEEAVITNGSMVALSFGLKFLKIYLQITYE